MKSIFTFGEKDFSAEFCADGFLSTRTYLHHNHCGNNVDRNKPAVIVKLNHGIKNDKTRGLISEETYSLLGWSTSSVYANEIYEYEKI